MAALTISLSGSSVVNGSKSFTISDADVQRWINQLTAASPLPAQTPQQVLVAWANLVVQRAIGDVQAFERAAAPITPITAS